MKTLRVATCQFSVEANIGRNGWRILERMEEAAHPKGADIVHFSECALSGYAGVDIPGIEALDWDQLIGHTGNIQNAARALKVWVLLGSTHRLSDGHKPHNCVYVINCLVDDPRSEDVTSL